MHRCDEYICAAFVKTTSATACNIQVAVVAGNQDMYVLMGRVCQVWIDDLRSMHSRHCLHAFKLQEIGDVTCVATGRARRDDALSHWQREGLPQGFLRGKSNDSASNHGQRLRIWCPVLILEVDKRTSKISKSCAPCLCLCLFWCVRALVAGS